MLAEDSRGLWILELCGRLWNMGKKGHPGFDRRHSAHHTYVGLIVNNQDSGRRKAMSRWNEQDPDAFPPLPPLPELSRSACLSPRGLRSFLSFSRHTADDVLRQRLNSLLNGKKDTSSTSTTLTKESICTQFAHSVIFPSWKARLSAIEFCDAESKLLELQLKQGSEPEVQRVIANSDLRIDPYAQRELEILKENKYRELNSLKNWVQNEKTIEGIVQQRSDEILRDSCGYDKWIESFHHWSTTLK